MQNMYYCLLNSLFISSLEFLGACPGSCMLGSEKELSGLQRLFVFELTCGHNFGTNPLICLDLLFLSPLLPFLLSLCVSSVLSVE